MGEFGDPGLEERVRAARALLSNSEGLNAWAPPELHAKEKGQERYPTLHEHQIEVHGDRHRDRAQRLQGHIRRVERQLLEDPLHRTINPASRRGRPRRVWCIEQRTVFPSVVLAARSVDRAPSNILQSIRRGYQCAGLHWSYYDPAQHTPVETGCAD